MNDEQFVSCREFCETPEGRALFTGTDLFLYHIRPLRCRLIEAGALITVGTRVKVRPKAFLREWTKISLESERGELKREPRVVKHRGEPVVKRVHVSLRGKA